jgi:hypothetical protein
VEPALLFEVSEAVGIAGLRAADVNVVSSYVLQEG